MIESKSTRSKHNIIIDTTRDAVFIRATASSHFDADVAACTPFKCFAIISEKVIYMEGMS